MLCVMKPIALVFLFSLYRTYKYISVLSLVKVEHGGTLWFVINLLMDPPFQLM